MPRVFSCFAILLTVASLASSDSSQAAISRSRPVVASESRSLGYISWRPLVEGIRLELAIAGPQGVVHRSVSGPGEVATFDVVDDLGHVLANGAYNWELRGRLDGDREHSLLGLVQRGEFVVREGLIVTGSEAEIGATEQLPSQQVIVEDLIVQGNVCAGGDCVDGEQFDPDGGGIQFSAAPYKITDPRPKIWFSDTDPGTNPLTTHDWLIETGGHQGGSGGNVEHFAIWDLDSGGGPTAPLYIRGAAPDNSLYIASNGNIGLGTSAPSAKLSVMGGASVGGELGVVGQLGVFNTTTNAATDVHIKTTVDFGDAADILLESDGFSTGPHAWRLAGDGLSFRLQELPDANPAMAPNVPFGISAGAPSSSLWIGTAGVGIGTTAPSASLHVEGDAIVTGQVSLGSSRTRKHELDRVEPEAALDAVLDLPLYRWKYKDDARQATHLGPMAEDFHASFEVGIDERHLSPGDSSGIALAAIQGLSIRLERRLEALEEAHRRLAIEREALAVVIEENRELQQRLEWVERALGSLPVLTNQMASP